MNMAETQLYPAACQVLYPCWGLMPNNKNVSFLNILVFLVIYFTYSTSLHSASVHFPSLHLILRLICSQFHEMSIQFRTYAAVFRQTSLLSRTILRIQWRHLNNFISLHFTLFDQTTVLSIIQQYGLISMLCVNFYVKFKCYNSDQYTNSNFHFEIVQMLA